MRISDWSSDVCSSDLCAGSRRYHDRLARLRLAEMHQSDPGGDAGRTERAEIGRRRRGIDVDLLHVGGSGDAVILPAEPDHDPVPGPEIGNIALDELAHRAADHDLDRKSTRLNSSH